jgi:coatomer protein complex subunit alpha (xenin)
MIADEQSEGVSAGLVAKNDGGEAEGCDDDLGDEDGGHEFMDAEDDEGDGWTAKDYIELLPDVDFVTSTKDAAGPATHDGYFVALAHSVPPKQHWYNNNSLHVDHVLAGNLESTFRLFHDQVGVVDFLPCKQLFLSTFSRSHTMFSCLASTPSLPHHSQFISKTPCCCMKLSDLISRLQSAYQLTTSGKFTEAVSNFLSILLSIPLLEVEDQKTQQLLTICSSYLVELGMESKRKEFPKAPVEDQVRKKQSIFYIASNLSNP